MSTVAEKRPSKSTPKDPVSSYREMVFSAAKADDGREPDESILDKAGRLASDFMLDVARFARRLAAAETIRVEVPRLEQEAEALRREIADAKSGSQLVSDCKTIAELFHALRRYEWSNDSGVITDQRLRLQQLTSQITEARRESQKVLVETADPSIGKRSEEIQRQINVIAERCKGRAPLLAVESRIATMQHEADALKERDRAKGLAGITPAEREKYRSLLAKVRELELQRPQVEAAAEADRGDREAIARLQSEAAELGKQRMIPESMAWER